MYVSRRQLISLAIVLECALRGFILLMAGTTLHWCHQSSIGAVTTSRATRNDVSDVISLHLGFR